MEPPLPRDISAIPRKIIWVARVTIMGGSSVKLVSTRPLIRPQAAPVRRQTRTTPRKGRPLLQVMQAKVADRQTVAPTEISISPRIRMKAMGSIMKPSARYLGISRNTLLN